MIVESSKIGKSYSTVFDRNKIVQVLQCSRSHSYLKVAVFNAASVNHKIPSKNNCLLAGDRKYKITSPASWFKTVWVFLKVKILIVMSCDSHITSKRKKCLQF